MTRAGFVLAALMLSFANTVAAQEETPLPEGATPSFVFLSQVNLKDQIAVGTSTVTKFVYETYLKEVIDEAGNKKTVPVTVCKPVMETRAQTLSLAEGHVFDATSAKLTAEQIALRVKAGVAVVVVPQGVKIAPVYRLALAPTTLILVAPLPAPPENPAPAPAQVPAPAP